MKRSEREVSEADFTFDGGLRGRVRDFEVPTRKASGSRTRSKERRKAEEVEPAKLAGQGVPEAGVVFRWGSSRGSVRDFEESEITEDERMLHARAISYAGW